MSVRRFFPAIETSAHVYLNTAAGGPISRGSALAAQAHYDEALEAGDAFFRWVEECKSVRTKVARFVGASGAANVAFMANASSALSSAIHSVLHGHGRTASAAPGWAFLAPEEEFPCVTITGLSAGGVMVPVAAQPASGAITMEAVEAAWEQHEQANADCPIRFLVCSAIQSQSGYRLDLRRMGEWCQSKGIAFIVDGTQAVGMVPIHFNDCHVDFLVFSAYKWLNAGYGVAVLVVADRNLKHPAHVGWRGVTDEMQLRNDTFEPGGTAAVFELGHLPFAAINALNASLDLQNAIGLDVVWRNVMQLRDFLLQQLAKHNIPICDPGHPDAASCIVCIPCSDATTAVTQLKAASFIVSARGGRVRVSPHFYNTQDELQRFVEALAPILHALPSCAAPVPPAMVPPALPVSSPSLPASASAHSDGSSSSSSHTESPRITSPRIRAIVDGDEDDDDADDADDDDDDDDTDDSAPDAVASKRASVHLESLGAALSTLVATQSTQDKMGTLRARKQAAASLAVMFTSSPKDAPTATGPTKRVVVSPQQPGSTVDATSPPQLRNSSTQVRKMIRRKGHSLSRRSGLKAAPSPPPSPDQEGSPRATSPEPESSPPEEPPRLCQSMDIAPPKPTRSPPSLRATSSHTYHTSPRRKLVSGDTASKSVASAITDSSSWKSPIVMQRRDSSVKWGLARAGGKADVIATRKLTARSRRALRADCVAIFNGKPEKGLAIMREKGLCGNTAAATAEYLWLTAGIDKKALGELFGEELHQPLLAAYIERLRMRGVEIDFALRRLLFAFRLPGEAQKIDRIVESFSRGYVRANPVSAGGPFDDPDTVHILSFAIIMLNTDQHSKEIKNKMTKAQFLRNLSGVGDQEFGGKGIPDTFLASVYDRICQDEIRMENALYPYAVFKGYVYGRATFKKGMPPAIKGSPLVGKDATRHWWVLEDEWGESARSGRMTSAMGSTLMAFKDANDVLPVATFLLKSVLLIERGPRVLKGGPKRNVSGERSSGKRGRKEKKEKQKVWVFSLQGLSAQHETGVGMGSLVFTDFELTLVVPTESDYEMWLKHVKYVTDPETWTA